MSAIKLDRVILSSDANPFYLEFWPIVARAWKEIVGIKPTLVLIADMDVCVDETIGEVMRFEPIQGVSIALQTQVIRLLIPAFFENEVSIISDIDMLPLNKNYFIKELENIPDENFLVYRDKAYENNSFRYPMCYNAAKGSTFKEIFKVNTLKDIPHIIKAWASLNLGWPTDEFILYAYLNNWKKFHSKCTRLGHSTEKRIDRSDNLTYDTQLLQNNYYIDAHLLRPYSQYAHEINQLLGLFKNAKAN